MDNILQTGKIIIKFGKLESHTFKLVRKILEQQVSKQNQLVKKIILIVCSSSQYKLQEHNLELFANKVFIFNLDSHKQIKAFTFSFIAGFPPRPRRSSTTAVWPPAQANDNTECSPPLVFRLTSAP